MAWNLKRTVAGLIKRYEEDEVSGASSQYPFATGDWTAPTAGGSLALSGTGALRYTTASGPPWNLWFTANNSAPSGAEHLVSAVLDVVSSGGDIGVLAQVSNRNAPNQDGIIGDIAANWTNNRRLIDYGSGSGTVISQTVGGINRGASPNRYTVWCDGLNASFRDFTGGYSEIGAQVNAHSGGDGGVQGSAGVAMTVDVLRFYSMEGRYINVSGLASGQIGKLIDWSGNITTLDSDTAGAPGTIQLDAIDALWPFVTLAVFESDGTTLVAAVEEVWGGDTFVLENTVSEALVITNPGAESGDETGWTVPGGSTPGAQFGAPVYEGSWHWTMNANVTSSSWAYQDVAIPAAWEAGIDAGIHRIDHTYWSHATVQGGARGDAYMAFYDGVPALISTAWTPEYYNQSNSTWFPRGAVVSIPPGTRYVRIWMRSAKVVNRGKSLDIHTLTLLSGESSPYQPSIVSVDPLTANDGTVNGSAYSHNAGRAHESSRVQVRLQGASDWTTLIYDSGVVAASEALPIDGMELLTWYEARLQYKDEDDVWSPWSPTFAFRTTDTPGEGIPFEWDNWAQIWNVQPAVYFGEFIGPGGWHTINFLPDVDCNNPWDKKLASFGRLLGPPSAVVYQPTPNRGADVKARFGWWSSQVGYTWAKYYDCEWARSGLVACACGTATANNPQAAHDIWAPYGTYEWTYSSDFQGIFAYFEPFPQWPYNPSDNGYFGDAPAELIVDIYHAGEMVKRYRYTMPERIIFSHYCHHFPWWGLRLKVWHDYDADSTGKTHRIQVSYTVPPDNRRGTAAIPSDSDPWVHDITWVGGHDESTVGAGDGGLRCGYSGYGSDRHTGVVSTGTYGANVYRDFLFEALEEAFCGAPCDADYIPEEEPEVPTPPPTQPISEPCPPVEEGEFQNVFLGGKEEGSLFQFGGYEVEAGRDIVAKIQPNAVAPVGYGGECHFKSVIVAVEHIGDISIGLVPIINGERLDAYAQEELFVGPGDRVQIRRYEVPLYRGFEDAVVEGTEDDRFKYGLRGAFFAVEISIVDICGLGINVSGVEYDYDVVRESQATGIVYTEHLLRTPAFQSTGGAFIGGTPGLLKAGSGVTDDGAVVEARVVSNPVAPAGIGGECVFNRISLTVTRWNAAIMELLVTPIIDGNEMAPVTINYKATTNPVTEITEVQVSELYVSDDGIEQFRYRPRGAWLAVKIETGDGLQEWLSIEGVDLDYDVARESMMKRLVDRGGSGFTDEFDGGFR